MHSVSLSQWGPRESINPSHLFTGYHLFILIYRIHHSIRQLLNINWEVLFEGLNTEKMWSLLHSKLLYLIDKYVTTQTFSLTLDPSGLTLQLLKQLNKIIKHGTPTKLLTVMMTMFLIPWREILLLLLSKEQNLLTLILLIMLNKIHLSFGSTFERMQRCILMLCFIGKRMVHAPALIRKQHNV